MPAPTLNIKELKVRSLDIDFQELSWKVGDIPSHVDVLDFTFQVFRSESPSGPFESLGGSFEDRYLFVDNQVHSGNRWRKYFYKLRITHKRTGDARETDPVCLEPDADLYALEIRRHMQLLMHEFAGRMCWILPVRTFGQRCSCFDRTLGAKTRSGCRTCYDTGFVRGYLSPIEAWAQIDPSPKADQTSQVGNMQQSNTTGRMGYYPPLKPDDVIVEAENRRWRVVTVTQTEKSRAALHQELGLHEIQPKDIEFDIPIRLDTALRDLWVSPARNFSNPSSLENFENEVIPHVFALYRTNIPEPRR
jgi:hypothetical protein